MAFLRWRAPACELCLSHQQPTNACARARAFGEALRRGLEGKLYYRSYSCHGDSSPHSTPRRWSLVHFHISSNNRALSTSHGAVCTLANRYRCSDYQRRLNAISSPSAPSVIDTQQGVVIQSRAHCRSSGKQYTHSLSLSPSLLLQQWQLATRHSSTQAPELDQRRSTKSTIAPANRHQHRQLGSTRSTCALGYITTTWHIFPSSANCLS